MQNGVLRRQIKWAIDWLIEIARSVYRARSNKHARGTHVNRHVEAMTLFVLAEPRALDIGGHGLRLRVERNVHGVPRCSQCTPPAAQEPPGAVVRTKAWPNMNTLLHCSV
jgi:hypothetical protein